MDAQRAEQGYASTLGADPEVVRQRLGAIKARLAELDQRVGPLAEQSGELANPRWGLMMRAGLDKSYLARQIERYADAYTSRVSNLLAYTPHVYLRAPRVSLPHDADDAEGDWTP